MEDHRTRQTLDALADLFLTEAGATATDRAARPRRDDGLGGPAPIRIEPKPAAVPQRAGAAVADASTVADADAPTLRLHRDETEPTAGRPSRAEREPLASPAARVEAVILGHLPGLAGPWLTQYAQHCAASSGAAAVLMHVSPDRIDLEVVHEQPETPTRHGDAARRAAPDRREQDPVAVLDAALREPGRPVRHVLVHLDPQSDEDDLARALELDDWTFVTGDDAAAVAAVIAAVRHLCDRDPEARCKRVGLMVMGASPAAADAAVAHVRDALHDELDHPVRRVGVQPRMAPVSLRPLGSFETPNLHWPRLLRLLLDLPEPEPASAPAAAPAAERASARGDDRPQRSAPAPDPAPQRAPAPASTPASTTLADPDLAELLTRGSGPLAGGIALEARCPQQPATQLLLDQDGRVHLLRRANAPSLDALRSALFELLEARRWTAEHRDLLQLTQRQLRFADTPPAIHLLLDRADLATKLAMKLGDHPGFDLHLHLLQQVHVADHATWFCTQLT